MQIHKFLEELWKLLSISNQSITNYEPWVKMKNGKSDEAMALIGLVANLLAKVSILLSPVMPKCCDKIANALGFDIDINSYNNYIKSDKLLNDFKIEKIPPLFPKIDEKLMLSPEPSKPKEDVKKEEDGLITFEQFLSVSLKIGTVIEVYEVEGSQKLLKLKVDIGESKPRDIIAGIKEFYSASDLLNTQVCVVANLKPAKIMGNLSEGMLLASKDKSGLHLIRPEAPKKVGTPIK
jgi:methionyl-tRNA synthetase